MPLSLLPYREVVRKLEAAGFVEMTQKGSHVKFVKHGDEETCTVIVPRHREITVGALRSIARQARLTIDKFEAL